MLIGRQPGNRATGQPGGGEGGRGDIVLSRRWLAGALEVKMP